MIKSRLTLIRLSLCVVATATPLMSAQAGLTSYAPVGWTLIHYPNQDQIDCIADHLEVELQSLPTPEQRLARLDQYFTQCSDNTKLVQVDNEIQVGIVDSLDGLLKLASPNLRKIPQFKVKDGYLFPAILGIQRSQFHPGAPAVAVKRPLVIIKCGTQCDLNHFTEQTPIAQLFDEGPFHVLGIPSMTGSDFQKLNGFFAAGGYQEGMNLLEIAKAVVGLDSPIARDQNGHDLLPPEMISSVHVVGLSLGGNAAAIAAYLASKRENLNPLTGKPYIQSATVISPALDLLKAMQRLFIAGADSLIGKSFFKSFWAQISSMFKTEPEILQVFKDAGLDTSPQAKPPAPQRVPTLIARAAIPGYRARLGFGADFDEDKFWTMNNFVELVDSMEEPVPINVLHAANDRVIFGSENAERLKGKKNIFYLEVPYGSHCMQGNVYGWHLSGIVLRQLILAQTPELEMKFDRVALAKTPGVNIPEPLGKSHGGEYIGVKMTLRAGVPRILVQSRSFSRERIPDLMDVVNADITWHEARGQIAMNIFGVSADAILSEGSAEAMSRWLNANVSLYNEEAADGKHWLRSDAVPDFAVIKRYELR